MSFFTPSEVGNSIEHSQLFLNKEFIGLNFNPTETLIVQCFEYPTMILRGWFIVTNEIELKMRNIRLQFPHLIVVFEQNDPEKCWVQGNRIATLTGEPTGNEFGSLEVEADKITISDLNYYNIPISIFPKIAYGDNQRFREYYNDFYTDQTFSEVIQVNNPSNLLVLRQYDGTVYLNETISKTGTYTAIRNLPHLWNLLFILIDPVTNEYRVLADRVPTKTGIRAQKDLGRQNLIFTDDETTRPLQKLDGNFIKLTGGAGDLVLVRSWGESEFENFSWSVSAIPESNGDWTAYVPREKFDVSYYSECFPIIHGPYGD